MIFSLSCDRNCNNKSCSLVFQVGVEASQQAIKGTSLPPSDDKAQVLSQKAAEEECIGPKKS